MRRDFYPEQEVLEASASVFCGQFPSDFVTKDENFLGNVRRERQAFTSTKCPSKGPGDALGNAPGGGATDIHCSSHRLGLSSLSEADNYKYKLTTGEVTLYKSVINI